MFESRATRNLAFVSRQVAQLADDATLDEALQQFAGAAPRQYEPDFERLRDLLTADSIAPDALGVHPLGSLFDLIQTMPEGRDVVFRGFIRYLDRSRAIFHAYWSGIAGLLLYLAVVSAVALIITFVFSTSVYPSIQGLFASFGSELPASTRMLFRFFGVGPLFSGLALLLLLGSTAAGVLFVRRRVQQARALPAVPRWVPFAGHLSRVYNLDLFLNLARILHTAGASDAEAVKIAAKSSRLYDAQDINQLAELRSGSESDAILNELGIAARLGKLGQELDIQCDEHASVMITALSHVRDRAALVLKILLFAFASLLIVGMYAPLFELGSVVV